MSNERVAKVKTTTTLEIIQLANYLFRH